MHNIVIAGAGRPKRSQAIRAIEELLARTSNPVLTIPLHTPKSDDVPEVLAWAWGTAKRLNVPFNLIMIEEDYDTTIAREADEDFDLANRLIKEAKDVVLMSDAAQVFAQAVQDADEVVLAWADEDATSAKVLRLAQKRALPVTDITQSIDPSAGETDEDDDEDEVESGSVHEEDDADEEVEEQPADPAPKYVLEDVSDPLRDAINGLVEALVVEVLHRVTERLKAAQ